MGADERHMPRSHKGTQVDVMEMGDGGGGITFTAQSEI